jgi:hypothetical protein
LGFLGAEGINGQEQANGVSPLERLIFQSEKIVVQVRFRQQSDINVGC